MPRITGQSRNDTSEAGGTATAERTKRQTKAQTEKLAKSYFQAVTARDPDAIASFWDADGVDELVPIGALRGPEEIRGFFREMFAAFPDADMQVQSITADSKSAAVIWTMTATFTGSPFQGIEATGKRVELRGCDVLEIEDGKLRRNTAYYDGLAFARAVGLMPPKDSGPERAMFAAFNAKTKLQSRIRARRGG